MNEKEYEKAFVQGYELGIRIILRLNDKQFAKLLRRYSEDK